MKYVNITPETHVERPFMEKVFAALEPHFDDTVSLCVRSWEQETDPRLEEPPKNIAIITSAEGHKYIPADQDNADCLGAFMHYSPKARIDEQYMPGFFREVPNLYPLQLGCTSFFEGNNDIPFHDREYDFSFIGQLDPYRRIDFYHGLKQLQTKRHGCVHLYEGWNNGVGGEEYSRVMSNTKVALVPWGSASLDTFRFYEAAQCGCVILSAPQNTYEFMHGSPHIEIKTWENMGGYLEEILINPEQASKTGSQTYEFWQDNLSPDATAQYILSKVEQ